MHKKIVVFAGPNRSGKSTLYDQRKDGIPEILLSVNELVKSPSFSTIYDERTMYLSAVNHASFLAQSLVEQGLSFSIETVFSSKIKLDFLEMAKQQGYELELVFVGTSSPQVNINRVEEGPYDVAWLDIINRYEKSLQNLKRSWNLFSSIEVYDGSGSKPTLYVNKKNDTIFFFEKSEGPEWIYDVISGVEVTKTKELLQS